MKVFKIIIVISVFVSSCVVQNTKYFSSVEQTQNKDYGYTPMEPVEIKNGPLESSISTSYYSFREVELKKERTWK
ncbi:MAG: PBP1b-binding outer membrane lipoprotein LpoB [Luteibaculaceae bacterium]|jgi:PBP1b-binding outer membrane lipoprotein LpoB